MISFIIPTYNEEKVIAETIERLRREFTLLPSEIIVTDDGSTDQTVQIAKPLADKVITGPKVAIGANRNRGAAVARYPYLVFLDSTVTVPNPNDLFKKALDIFKAEPRLAGLVGNVNIYPATTADKFFTWLINLWFALNINYLGLGFANGKMQIIKADNFKKAGGYLEDLIAGEDSELFHRLSKNTKTRWEKNLKIYHPGRREHALGWPRVLFLWASNGLAMVLLKRSVSKEWKAIR